MLRRAICNVPAQASRRSSAIAFWNVDCDFHFAGPLVSFCIHGMVRMGRKMQYSLNTYGEKLEKAEWDLYHCWNQVGDEDNCIAQQAARIDGLHNQFMMMDGCLTEASNEASMSHDYMVDYITQLWNWVDSCVFRLELSQGNWYSCETVQWVQGSILTL